MTTAERLTTIAENVSKVYEAGKKAGGTTAPVEEKDVNFWDYDGTLLHSYTLAEAQAMTELPTLPTREGLICQSWNWTLEQIKSLPSDSIGADVGAYYWTNDRATHCYFEIYEPINNSVVLNFSGTVDIDWGDGETTTGATSTANHIYKESGIYIAKITSNGNYTLGGGTAATRFVGDDIQLTEVRLASNANTSNYWAYNNKWLRTVSLGTRAAHGYGMQGCRSLTALVVSGQYSIGLNGVYNCSSLRIVAFTYTTNLQNQCFRDCASLRRVAVGKLIIGDAFQFYGDNSLHSVYPEVSQCGQYMFYNTTSLKRLKLAKSITSIDTWAFYNSAIPFLDIPESVTSIGASAFQYASLKRLRFLPTTPPTVANANAFTGILTDCVVEVPAASLEAYQNATNYSGIAAQMIGV